MLTCPWELPLVLIRPDPARFSNPLNPLPKKPLQINTGTQYTLPIYALLPANSHEFDGITSFPMTTAGLIGGIERFTKMAIARTFRIVSHERNRNEVRCKSCGVLLPFDTGHMVQWNVYSSMFKPIYLCWDCFLPVKNANEAFPVKWKPDHDGKELPPWWGELDRPPRTTRPDYSAVTFEDLKSRGVIR